MTCDFVTGPTAVQRTSKGDYIVPIMWVCTKCGKIINSTVNAEVPFSFKICEKDKEVTA